MAFNWVCPFCNSRQTVTSANFASGEITFEVSDPIIGPIGIKATAITCANPECRNPTVSASIVAANWYGGRGSMYIDKNAKTHSRHQLMPGSSAKPQPGYIPKAISEDYEEACKIRDLSPKASATLSRRCLQGMIRDFCGVSGKTLYAEIEALRALVGGGRAPAGVSIESVEAIHDVREVGNIGAHMQKEIDHIVPVEPEEAQLLIDLIESLFDEWYVERETRARRFGGVKALAENKRALISELKSSKAE